MKEPLISLETAKLAKDKGFNWKCIWFFNEESTFFETQVFRKLKEVYFSDDSELNNYNNIEGHISAPTQSLLQKWLREEHKIHVEVWYNYFREHWDFSLFNLSKHAQSSSRQINVLDMVRFADTYENALEKGLFKSLNLIIQSQKIY